MFFKQISFIYDQGIHTGKVRQKEKEVNFLYTPFILADMKDSLSFAGNTDPAIIYT